MGTPSSADAPSPTDFGHSPESDDGNNVGDLRNWCTGQPPKRPGFGAFLKFPPRGRHSLSRRSTLADKPELDVLLAATLVEYKGKKHLPLSAKTLRRLSPLWKGEKPLANFHIFERLLLNKEINTAHADHVISALERVGGHCKHLVIISPIHISEYGDVLNREDGNINTGNDWDKIIACFPNLETATFEHPQEEPSELSRSTFANFHRAIEDAHIGSLREVDMQIPPHVMNELELDFGDLIIQDLPETSEDESSLQTGSTE
jgi:hypothetical protein